MSENIPTGTDAEKEVAATKIQAVMRGKKTRNQMSDESFEDLIKRLKDCKSPAKKHRKRRPSLSMGDLRPQELEELKRIEFPHGIKDGTRVFVEARMLDSVETKNVMEASSSAEEKTDGEKTNKYNLSLKIPSSPTPKDADQKIPIHFESYRSPSKIQKEKVQDNGIKSSEQSLQRDEDFVPVNMHIEFKSEEMKISINGHCHDERITLSEGESFLYPGDGVKIYNYKIDYENVAHSMTMRCLEKMENCVETEAEKAERKAEEQATKEAKERAKKETVQANEQGDNAPEDDDWKKIVEAFDDRLQLMRWESVQKSDVLEILKKFTDDDIVDAFETKQTGQTGQTGQFPFLMTQLIIWDTLMGTNKVSDDTVGQNLWSNFCRTVKEKGKFPDKDIIQESSARQLRIEKEKFEDLDVRQQREILYFVVEATCFFSLKAKVSFKHALRYEDMKNECLSQIGFLLESTEKLDFVLELDKGRNPLQERSIQPLALALHYQMGDILSFPKIQHLVKKLWYDELFDSYYSMVYDYDWFMDILRSPDMTFGRCGMKVHSSLYRKVPILFALTELVFWVLLLVFTYWVLWRENRDYLEDLGDDKTLGDPISIYYDNRHTILIFLGLGFFCHVLSEIYRSTFYEYWKNSLSNVVDFGTWSCFLVWLYYKIFRGNDVNAYWVLSVNSIFMLFGLLRYFAIAQKNDTMVPSLVEMLKDVLGFLRLYFLFLWGFSFVIHCVFWETEDFSTAYSTVLNLFASTLGAFEFEWFSDHPAQRLGDVLLCFFLVVNMILLFNMLIAILSRTFEKTSEDAKHRWSLVNAQFLRACQMAHGHPADYQVVTADLPPPFTLVSVLFTGWFRWAEGPLCYALDVLCTVALFLLPCLVLDFGVYLLQLELRVGGLVSKVVPSFQSLKTGIVVEGRGCLAWCGKVLGVVFFQAVGIPLLAAVYLVVYPFFFLCHATSVHTSAKKGSYYFKQNAGYYCGYGGWSTGEDTA